MNESYRHSDGKSMRYFDSVTQLHQKGMQRFFLKKRGKRWSLRSAIHGSRKKTVTQACRPTALKRTDERMKNCIILLDLSSPASSESVMFLSRTGAGGLETRLTEAIGERICLPSLRYKSELTQSLKETVGCERCWKISDWKKTHGVTCLDRVSEQTLSSFISMTF